VAITRDALQARAEAISDQPASTTLTFVTAAQAVDFVNDGIRTLYNDVVDAHPDFRVTFQTPFTLTSPNANSNALPADFRSVRAVKSDPGMTYEDFLPMYQLRQGRLAARRNYRVAGSLIYIEPAQWCQGTYQLLYTPQAPVLATGAATLDSELEQFQDVIVLHAAVMMLTKNEWDISTVAAQLGAAKARALKWASSQRSADPPGIEDVRTRSRQRLAR
jgi:hypothetical protein